MHNYSSGRIQCICILPSATAQHLRAVASQLLCAVQGSEFVEGAANNAYVEEVALLSTAESASNSFTYVCTVVAIASHMSYEVKVVVYSPCLSRPRMP